MVTTPIHGADSAYSKQIRAALQAYPSWYARSARISKIVVNSSPEVAAQIAMYEHGSRVLNVKPRAGSILLKAIGHELAHGVDDIFGQPHYFSNDPEWLKIHKNQAHFDIPKYAEEPLEYFADMVVKTFLLGPEKLRTTNPDEVNFIQRKVFPVLKSNFD